MTMILGLWLDGVATAIAATQANLHEPAQISHLVAAFARAAVSATA
ncbi:MAG: hypothetical protein KKA12_08575 [Alphaproteobacteria bacterium]|nr:hypothetical protein [Alphaproteobacteria bacterium]